MTSDLPSPATMLPLLLYGAAAVAAWVPYAWIRARRHRKNRARLEEAIAASLTEPPSLHPIIDKGRCLGCGTCVTACPEKGVLGLISGKAELIHPADCIGHGACKEACPFDAITLVLGTETRGVDIPLLDASFQTNVPGIFVAGELGGMGLIRNAIEQGRQAMDAIRRLPGMGAGSDLDVAIVGAGPAGFSASLAAMQHGLRAVTLEQETLGGTVAHYPRGKIVMTAPVDLPLHGKVKLRETTKEALLEFWEGVAKETGVEIRYGERVEDVKRQGDRFEVVTARGSYRVRAVLLAIGRRGTPRKLDVPGEHQSKVVYRLIDPEQYRNQRVIVVGGGDSALEAATCIAREPHTQVVISYRGAAFARAKQKNRAAVEEEARSGRLRVLLESRLLEITPDAVRIETTEGAEEIPNDAVVICAGGVLPTGFLKSIGVTIETKYGTL